MASTDDSRRHAAAFGELLKGIEEALKVAIKTEGFKQTLKHLERLERGRVPPSGMTTIIDGVAEKKPSGDYDLALQTDTGPLFLYNAQSGQKSQQDPQSLSTVDHPEGELATPDELLNELASFGVNAPVHLIYEIELTRFDANQRRRLLPLLWMYILRNRDDNRLETLTAAGAAIRKYIALMPMEDMGRLAVLLESGHKSVLPIELEIEIAKTIYRNFEVHPPREPNPHPELARPLWEMAQAYANPRLLMRDKHSAAALLAIQALVAMRSDFALNAVHLGAASPYRWFAELVADQLDRLHDRWNKSNPDIAVWLAALRKDVEVTK